MVRGTLVMVVVAVVVAVVVGVVMVVLCIGCTAVIGDEPVVVVIRLFLHLTEQSAE